MDKIKLIVADDHPVVVDGLTAILETQDDFSVIGTAEDGKQAIQLTKELDPDILLLDLEMPELNGVETLQELKNQNLYIDVIVFTAFDTDDQILSALKAGAKGYLLKGSPKEELFSAIRVVHQGGSLLQPIVTSKLIEYMSDKSERSKIKLTDRELEVLNFLSEGKLNKEVAQSLSISERTVKFHVSSILKKLDVQNRTEAVTKAAQLKLIEI